MRKRRLFLLLPLLAFMTSSCVFGRYTVRQGNFSFGQSSMTGTYTNLNGYISRKFAVKDAVSVIFHFEYHSASDNEGHLCLLVEGDVENTWENLTSGTQNFTLHRGNYTVKIEGYSHSGEFTLSWNAQ